MKIVFKLKVLLAAAVVAPLSLFLVEQGNAQVQSASAAAMLEEVIVTARRREESMQDLPLSIAALSADSMQAQGINNIDMIGDFIPNLSFNTTDRRHVKAVYIRGIGGDSPGNLRPVGAGMYIDGHYLPNTVGQMLSTVDIERIEVLRGPQGTLFGKNTTGGAINVVSAKPGQDFDASVVLRAGDYGQQDFRGMVNVPLSDTAAARFSMAKETSDGFYYNRYLNQDVGATDITAFGAAVRFTPNDNWMVDLSYRANSQDDDQAGGQCRPRPQAVQVERLKTVVPDNGKGGHPAQVYTGPTYSDGVKQWGGSTKYGDGNKYQVGGHLERLYPGATIDFWNACAKDNSLGTYVNSQEKDTFLELDNSNVNATVQWDSNGEWGSLDNLNVKLIASAHEMEFNYLQDRDMTYLSIDAIGTPPMDGVGSLRNTDNLEILFTGIANDRLDFVVGAHFFDDEARAGTHLNCLNTFKANIAEFSKSDSTLAITCQADGGTQFDRMPDRAVAGGPGIAGMSGLIANESKAVFAHLTYDISDNWVLDVGARYTDEDRLFNQAEIDAVASTCSHKGAGAPPTTSICTPDYILTHESVFLEGFYNDASANFTEVTPMVSLTRNLGGGSSLEDGMFYLLYAEGFLSGSFNDELNTNKVPELAPLLSYAPEHVDNFEVGFKGTFRDGRVRIAGALFVMEYADKHEGISVDNHDGRYGGDPQIQIVTNAATVDITGIELEVRAQPWDGGFITLDIANLQNEYGAFTSFDPDQAGGVVDRSNLSIKDYSPEWTVNASIEHTYLLGSGATLTPQLGMYYQSDYDFRTAVDKSSANSYCFQEAYTKFRGRVTYEPADANWQASLYGSNINDQEYFEICGASRSGVFDYRHGAPSMWGLEFSARFGG